MWRRIHIKSLKNKLILYFLLISIVPTVSIGYFYYKHSQSALEKNMINTSVNNLDYTMAIVDQQLKNAEQLSDWIFINRNLDDILTKQYSKEKIPYNSEIRTFLEQIDYQFRYNTSIGTYIHSLLIHGKNGLDLRAGQPEGTQVNIDQIRKMEWFDAGMRQHGKKFWYGVVPNPAALDHESYVLPLVRPILNSATTREIGWQLIEFRTNLISDLITGFEMYPDESLLVVDSRGCCIYDHAQKRVGRNMNRLDYIDAVLHRGFEGYVNVRIAGSKRLVVFAKSRLTGWSIVKILSTVELNRQKRVLLNITLIILISSLIFTSLLSVYLSSNLTRPWKKLLQKTKAIARGNFERDPSMEGEDELGVLGRGVNEMAGNIRSLLKRVMEDEAEKRRLELELLQNQVNPHFLYNTLNSLKLMATIQKADGIREMVSALGRLLMNLSKNTAGKITLEEELALLEDYVYIQNIRYKGKIKLQYHLENPKYLECKIIKFTLQPIVENAIFHGIEPKKDAGRIEIGITEGTQGELVICIEDDGVGMSASQIDALLATEPAGKSRGLSRIGIKNVNDRIKLEYGQAYGLSVASVVGEYTKVYLKIPREG